MKRRVGALVAPLHLAAVVIGIACGLFGGIACTSVGAIQTSPLIHVIMLDKQGKCDVVAYRSHRLALEPSSGKVNALT